MSGAAVVVQGDALRLPLPDESVDLIVTSPPYFCLRAYDGNHPNMVGSEPTPQAYLEALWAATAEMARVLKPSGSIFVDLGDKYGRPGGGVDVNPRSLAGVGNGYTKRVATPTDGGGRDKSLMLLPERYRIGCVDRLDLIARAVIVWSKVNSLPESVRDRVRRSHEDWVHLVRQPRYYSAVDEVREPHAPTSLSRYGNDFGPTAWTEGTDRRYRAETVAPNPLGKLPGSVWTIPSEPLRLPDHLGTQHYAAFPSEWPRRLILGWSPPGICVACGQGRWPVVDRQTPELHEWAQEQQRRRAAPINGGIGAVTLGIPAADRQTTILGYACACTPHTNHPGTGNGNRQNREVSPMPGARPQGTYGRHQAGEYQPSGPWREYHLDRWTPPPTRPAVVLDPFVGTGTTPMVARALGRIGIGLDLSHNYCRAARWRIHHDAGKAIARTNLERQGSLL